MKLSDKLIELRKEKGWSQEDLAEKLDVSRQAISRWENGTALPDALNILAISRLFDVTADYLLNDEHEKCKNEEKEICISEKQEVTSEEEPPIKKKKYPYIIFAICLVILCALTAWATIDAQIQRKALEDQGLHVHAVISAVVENEIAPTCTAEGSYDEVFYCSVCNEEVVRTKKSVGKISHTPASSFKENEIAPTCSVKGLYDEVICCSECNTELVRTRKATEKSSHKPAMSVKENEVAPTCTKKGSYDEVVYCRACKAEMLRTPKSTEMAAHWYEDKKCVVCGDAKPSEGLIYMSNGNGTCTVDRGTCTDENVVIPPYSPTGEKVIQIKAYAFRACSYLKSVKIPETVTFMGEGVFMDCYNLESVNLPSKLSLINSYMFSGCESLKEVSIPKSVSTIGFEAFAECYSCESIVIPASVSKICKFAFRNFSGGDGIVTFEKNQVWKLYDDSEQLCNFIDLTISAFPPCSYLTFRYSNLTWRLY